MRLQVGMVNRSDLKLSEEYNVQHLDKFQFYLDTELKTLWKMLSVVGMGLRGFCTVVVFQIMAYHKSEAYFIFFVVFSPERFLY